MKNISTVLERIKTDELYDFLGSRPGLGELVKHRDPDLWDGGWSEFKALVEADKDEWLNVQRILKLIGFCVIPTMRAKLKSQEIFFSDTFVETFKKTLPFYLRCTFGSDNKGVITKKSGRNAYHKSLLPEFRISFQHTYDLFKLKRKEIYKVLPREKTLDIPAKKTRGNLALKILSHT